MGECPFPQRGGAELDCIWGVGRGVGVSNKEDVRG